MFLSIYSFTHNPNVYFSHFYDIIFPMVVRMRHTKGHTRNRRSHHALKAKNLLVCKNCGALIQGHKMCDACGYYKGKLVLKVKAKKAQ